MTRTQFPAQDLGDSEQTPVDLGEYADYTHLTAMLAPRPALLTHNAFDNCCFRADYALGPLLVAAEPIYKLFNQPGRLQLSCELRPWPQLRSREPPGLLPLSGRDFFPGGSFPDEEKPAELRTPEAVRMALPEPNETFHSLAVKLSETLPRAADIPTDPARLRKWQADYRKKLREIVRWTDYKVTHQAVVEPAAWRLSVNGWTIPALEFAPDQPVGTTLVFGDEGKAKLASEIAALVEQKQRVIAIDPFYFGEIRIENRDYLFALLVSSLGERPLGIQAGQVAAVARWLQPKYGK